MPFERTHTIALTKEKTPETVKEPLTPSSLLKRIKSHRRQWSSGRNIFKDIGSKASTPSSLAESEKSTQKVLLDKDSVSQGNMKDLPGSPDVPGTPSSGSAFSNDGSP